MEERSRRRGRLASAALWILAAIMTVGCFMYQDKTGPTYPLEGEFQTPKGPVSFRFMRSETIGRGLAIAFLEPVPEGVVGYVRYRRFRSDDEWSIAPMRMGEFEFSRRGRTERAKGLGATLPSLQERAGKYEYYVYYDDGGAVSVTGDKAIYARYKAHVPMLVLIAHILVIFASMTIAIRTVLGAVANGKYKRLIWATVGSLLLGGFVFGPMVQWYAFGVWWSGVPYDIDWTDNKVLVELLFWLLAAYLNRGVRRSRGAVYLAGIVTLLVYFIPHSVFGSEYDYRIGGGRGTAG